MPGSFDLIKLRSKRTPECISGEQLNGLEKCREEKLNQKYFGRC